MRTTTIPTMGTGPMRSTAVTRTVRSSILSGESWTKLAHYRFPRMMGNIIRAADRSDMRNQNPRTLNERGEVAPLVADVLCVQRACFFNVARAFDDGAAVGEDGELVAVGREFEEEAVVGDAGETIQLVSELLEIQA